MNAGFWDIPDITNIKTPVSILKEQGSALGQATKGLLHGLVTSTPSSDMIFLKLDILVPSLNGYTYSIIEYIHPMLSSYPGRFISRFTKGTIIIDEEQQFVENLQRVLSSDSVKKVLEGLMLQANSASR